MQLNYFGSLRLTLGFLPVMAQRRSGHVINISSIGVLTNAPRFSAYVASKAALEAWARCAASEFLDRGVHFTTVNMPLVRTEMVSPTKMYEKIPMLSPDEAADIIVDAIIRQPGADRHAPRRIWPGRQCCGAADRSDHHEHQLPDVSRIQPPPRAPRAPIFRARIRSPSPNC